MSKALSKIAYVRWFDSGITDHTTIHSDDAAGVMELESVGLVIREDENSITLALDRSLTTGNLRSTLCIPKVNARKIVRFKAMV